MANSYVGSEDEAASRCPRDVLAFLQEFWDELRVLVVYNLTTSPQDHNQSSPIGHQDPAGIISTSKTILYLASCIIRYEIIRAVRIDSNKQGLLPLLRSIRRWRLRRDDPALLPQIAEELILFHMVRRHDSEAKAGTPVGAGDSDKMVGTITVFEKRVFDPSFLFCYCPHYGVHLCSQIFDVRQIIMVNCPGAVLHTDEWGLQAISLRGHAVSKRTLQIVDALLALVSAKEWRLDFFVYVLENIASSLAAEVPAMQPENARLVLEFSSVGKMMVAARMVAALVPTIACYLALQCQDLMVGIPSEVKPCRQEMVRALSEEDATWHMYGRWNPTADGLVKEPSSGCRAVSTTPDSTTVIEIQLTIDLLKAEAFKAARDYHEVLFHAVKLGLPVRLTVAVARAAAEDCKARACPEPKLMPRLFVDTSLASEPTFRPHGCCRPVSMLSPVRDVAVPVF